MQKLNLILGYLAKTQDSKLRYDGKNNPLLTPKCFIDAIHAVHNDGSNRTGVIITVAGGQL